MKVISFGFIIITLLFSAVISADRLPNQAPENQSFMIDTTISAIGMVKDGSSLAWTLTNKDMIPQGQLRAMQTIESAVYYDKLMTNGGKFREVRNYDFVSQNRGRSRYNIDNEKILTYNSISGTHLIGDEEYYLSTAGNPTPRSENIRCIFSTKEDINIPTFCNVVSAKSSLNNINNAKGSTRGQIRSVSIASIPAALRYRIAITPDETQGNGFADGFVSTEFSGSILESRNYETYRSSWNKVSGDNTWKDKTEISGRIMKMQKVYSYNSGVII